MAEKDAGGKIAFWTCVQDQTQMWGILRVDGQAEQEEKTSVGRKWGIQHEHLCEREEKGCKMEVIATGEEAPVKKWALRS